MLPEKIKDILVSVLDHFGDDERSDYPDWYQQHDHSKGGNHIYEDLALLRLWVEHPDVSIEELESVTNEHLDNLRRRHAA
jgi:hypothetical protein